METNFTFGRMWSKLGQIDKAIAAFLQVAQLSPDHTQAQYQLFLCYSRIRQPAQAEVALAEFKKLEELEKEMTRDQVNLERARKKRYSGFSNSKN